MTSPIDVESTCPEVEDGSDGLMPACLRGLRPVSCDRERVERTVTFVAP